MQATITRVDAATEILKRRKARNRLLDFASYIHKGYEVGNHHRILSEALERVESGDLKRLVVTMPPRHGKSMLISQLFPCWYLGRNPDKNVVQSGYSQDITLYHSRRARDYFVSPEFANLFPESRHAPGKVSQDRVDVHKQAAMEWGTVNGGRYYAVGVGGGLTGRGSDLALIDDPIKNRDDANSLTIRARIWDWYRSTFYTRLTPDGAIIIVMTRWHPDDLVGRCLRQMATENGDTWEVISFPALDDEENALWPDRYNAPKLKSIQNAIGVREWESLYQQNPKLVEGELIYDPYTFDKWPDSFDETIYGLDFGYNHAMALIRVDLKDGEAYLTEEIYQTGLTTPALISRMREIGINKRHWIYADSAEPDRIKEINDAGFRCKPAKKDVSSGIDYCQNVKMHSRQSNTNLNREREIYSWQTDRDGRPTDDPIKIDDHGMDAKRYAIFTHLVNPKDELKYIHFNLD